MDQGIGRLIDECKDLEPEMYRLLLLQLSFYPISMIQKVTKKISRKRLAELKKEAIQLGGWDEVINKYNVRKKNQDNKLSELAEYLEEKEFKIEKFKPQLSEAQFRWLKLNKKIIIEHLKGIELI